MALRKKDWCWTIHSGHFGDKTEPQICSELTKIDCTYTVFQLETGGDLGRDHIQGYTMFKTLKSMAQVKALMPCGAHLETRKAPKVSDAINYCKKDNTRRPGTNWQEYGEMPMDQGQKRTLVDAINVAKVQGYKQAMLQLPEVTIRYARGLREYAHIAAGERIAMQREVKVFYYWGDSGCGKTWHAANNYDTPDNTYVGVDMSDKIWMGNYAGERTLVIDEFKGKCDDSLFKCMLQGTKMEFQTKGGFVWAEWDTVIVTSNVDPQLLYDASINWWSVLPTPPGPFQRRFSTGGIHHGTGNYEMGTSDFDPPLPTRAEPDSGAAPDDPIMLSADDVPGVSFEPTTPAILRMVDDWSDDEFDDLV